MVDPQIAYTYRLHQFWKQQIVRVLNRVAGIVLVTAGVLMALGGLFGSFTFPLGLFALVAVLLAVASLLDGAEVPRPPRAEDSGEPAVGGTGATTG